MRRWILAVLLGCSALSGIPGSLAAGNSDLAGPAFCTSFPGTSATSASFNGVVACSGPGYSGPIAFMGSMTESGMSASLGGSWQCTEFASRYLLAVTGRSGPRSTSGAQWVARAHQMLPQYGLGGGAAGTGTFSRTVVPGVIISMRGGPRSDHLGHVAVVTAVSVTRGNGVITVVGENLAGYSTIHVVNGQMTYGSSADPSGRYYTSFQWLTGLPGQLGGPPHGNGALVRTPDGSVYVIAGDAPLRLGSCVDTPSATCSRAVPVPDLSEYMPVPADGTVLHEAPTGRMYVVAGGAPLRLGSCAFTPGGYCATAVTVDGYPIASLDHLRAVPTDGTVLHDGTSGRMYVVAGGAPLRLGSCAFTPGGYCATAVTVDGYPIASLDHLRAVPTDGTVLYAATTGHLYIFATGVLSPLRSCAQTPGGYCATAVTVAAVPVRLVAQTRTAPL